MTEVQSVQRQSLQTFRLHVAFRLAQDQCAESFMDCFHMGEQLHPNLTSTITKCCMEWCEALDRSGEPEFDGCQESDSCLTAWGQVWDCNVGSFFRSWLSPLVPVKGIFNAIKYEDI